MYLLRILNFAEAWRDFIALFIFFAWVKCTQEKSRAGSIFLLCHLLIKHREGPSYDVPYTLCQEWGLHWLCLYKVSMRDLVFRRFEYIACTSVNALIANKPCRQDHCRIFERARLAFDSKSKFIRVIQYFTTKVASLLPSNYKRCLKWLLKEFIFLGRLCHTNGCWTTDTAISHRCLFSLCVFSTWHVKLGLLSLWLFRRLAHEEVKKHCVYLNQISKPVKL